MKFIYNSCLLYINSNNKGLEVINLEKNNILIQVNDIFAAIKENELKKAKLLAKNREKLIFNTVIKFNRGYIRLVNDNNLFLS